MASSQLEHSCEINLFTKLQNSTQNLKENLQKCVNNWSKTYFITVLLSEIFMQIIEASILN